MARPAAPPPPVERGTEYEQFATDVSLPMFRHHDGFLGVVFAGTGRTRAVVTFWQDHEAIDVLNRSASYRDVVARIEATGFLAGPSSIEVLDIHGGWVLPFPT